jgi:tripartite-type tricarboxylate transporter receptor subunit TctC
MSSRTILAVLGLSLLAPCTSSAAEAPYPSKPIRIIVTFAPGATTDVIARFVAQKMTESWGQQVVVDNRGGAGGNIGLGLGAGAPPDGYTLTFVSSSLFVNPSLYRNVPYDPEKSFAPISNLAHSTHVFFSHASQPVKSMTELIESVKKDPKKFSMATPGIGTTPHISAHLLALDAKLDLVTVPYGGGGPSLAAVVGNQVPYGCQAIPPVTPHIKAGRVRAHAVTSAKRTDIVPDVPTMAELGFKGHEANTITGALAPAGTPRQVVAKLQKEMARIMELPDVKARVHDMGFEIVNSTPQEFNAQIKEEVAKWGKVIKAAKLKVE